LLGPCLAVLRYGAMGPLARVLRWRLVVLGTRAAEPDAFRSLRGLCHTLKLSHTIDNARLLLYNDYKSVNDHELA